MDFLEMQGAKYCEFEKGTYIIRQGETIDYLYYLISGTCQRILTTEKGDDIILDVKTSNNSVESLLGVLASFRNRKSMCYFFAKTKCCCYKIPKDNFWKYVQDKPAILINLLDMYRCAYEHLESSFAARQQGKVSNRLCEQLLKSSIDFQGKLLVNRSFSNAELSRMLGIHEVTVARVLKVLKDKGIISKDKDGITILNEKELVSYASIEKNIEY